MQEINLRRFDLNLLVVFDTLMTEGSVTRAAHRLGRTQSAVSHALARLREQVDDPLLVKVGGKMEPSPFALRLIDELRPTLRAIRGMLAPSQPFDKATSTRVFRLAIVDLAPSVIPELVARVRVEAPRVALQWVLPDPNTHAALADAQIDLALLGTTNKWPEGIVRTLAGQLVGRTYARKDHPAFESWGLDAWARYPHVQVSLGPPQRTTLQEALERGGHRRFIAAYVPHFSSALELLARTDLLATLPLLISGRMLEHLGVRSKLVPIEVEPVKLWIAWSFRQSKDPGNQWLRGLLGETLAESLAREGGGG